MGKYINRNTMIDPETGEIVKENEWLGYDGFSDKGFKYRHRQVHIKYFFDSMPGNLSEAAWMLLLMIAEIMNDDNVLVYRVERKSKFSKIVFKPYDKDEIRLRTRYVYGINKFDRCWTELNKHCLKKVKYYDYMVWAVNPAIINKCKEIPYWLCEDFQEYMTPHMTPMAVNKMQKRIKNMYE